MTVRWILAAALTLAPGATLGADNYRIDPGHTYPSLEFSHMGISTWRAKFNKTSGRITLDRAARSGSVEVQVDMDSIDFGHESMNGFAISEEWLHVDQFPTMTYRGKIAFNGDTPATIEGQLTLRGVTRPLGLRIASFKCIAHPIFRREVCGAEAEGALDRAAFGMSTAVGPDMQVRLRIQVEALKDN